MFFLIFIGLISFTSAILSPDDISKVSIEYQKIYRLGLNKTISLDYPEFKPISIEMDPSNPLCIAYPFQYQRSDYINNEKVRIPMAKKMQKISEDKIVLLGQQNEMYLYKFQDISLDSNPNIQFTLVNGINLKTSEEINSFELCSDSKDNVSSIIAYSDKEIIIVAFDELGHIVRTTDRFFKQTIQNVICDSKNILLGQIYGVKLINHNLDDVTDITIDELGLFGAGQLSYITYGNTLNTVLVISKLSGVVGVNIGENKLSKNYNTMNILGGFVLTVFDKMLYIGVVNSGKFSVYEYIYDDEARPYLNRIIPIDSSFNNIYVFEDVLLVDGDAMKTLILPRISIYLLDDSSKLTTTYLNVQKSIATILKVKNNNVYLEQTVSGSRTFNLEKKYSTIKCEGIMQLDSFGVKHADLKIVGRNCLGKEASQWGGCNITLPIQLEFYEKFTMDEKKAKGFGLVIAFFTVLLLIITIFGLIYRNYKSKLVKAEKYLVEVSSTYMEVSGTETPKTNENNHEKSEEIQTKD